MTKNQEINQTKLTYYQLFLDHAKKFMLDFKVSSKIVTEEVKTPAI